MDNEWGDSTQNLDYGQKIDADSAADALKVLVLYLLKLTKSTGEFVYDAIKYSIRMFSLTYGISETEVRKSLMARDIGFSVIDHVKTEPDILNRFDSDLVEMIRQFELNRERSSSYVLQRKELYNNMLQGIDERLNGIDQFLRESEARLKEARNKLVYDYETEQIYSKPEIDKMETLSRYDTISDDITDNIPITDALVHDIGYTVENAMTSLAFLNDSRIHLEELKDSINSKIDDLFNQYIDENPGIGITKDEYLKTISDTDDELRALLKEQAETEGRLTAMMP